MRANSKFSSNSGRNDAFSEEKNHSRLESRTSNFCGSLMSGEIKSRISDAPRYCRRISERQIRRSVVTEFSEMLSEVPSLCLTYAAAANSLVFTLVKRAQGNILPSCKGKYAAHMHTYTHITHPCARAGALTLYYPRI